LIANRPLTIGSPASATAYMPTGALTADTAACSRTSAPHTTMPNTNGQRERLATGTLIGHHRPWLVDRLITSTPTRRAESTTSHDRALRAGPETQNGACPLASHRASAVRRSRGRSRRLPALRDAAPPSIRR